METSEIYKLCDLLSEVEPYKQQNIESEIFD